MSLPKLQHPTFVLTIPSTNEQLRFRPYVTKEEKILLIAKEDKKLSSFIDALKQVIINCCEDEKGIDLDKLSLIDIEYLFLKLRAASVNNIQDIDIYDKEEILAEGNKAKAHHFEIDLNEVAVVFNENHKNQVKIDDTNTLTLKYPPANLASDVLDGTDEFSAVMNLLKTCLVSLHSKDEIFYFKDYKPEDIDEFLETIPLPVYEDIKEFFNTLPKLFFRIEYENNLGHKRVYIIDKLEDFFTLG